MALSRNKKSAVRKKSSPAKAAASSDSAPAKLASISVRLREASFILVLALAAFTLLSLSSYHMSDSGWSTYHSTTNIKNAAGLAGAWLADVMLYFCGYVAFLFPFAIVYLGWNYCFANRRAVVHDWLSNTFRIIGLLMLFVSAAALINISITTAWSDLPFTPGGVIGSLAGRQMLAAFNHQGALLFLYAGLLLGITLFSGLSWLKLAEWVGKAAFHAVSYICKSVANFNLAQKSSTFFSFFSRALTSPWRKWREISLAKAEQKSVAEKSKPATIINAPVAPASKPVPDVSARIAALKEKTQNKPKRDKLNNFTAVPGQAPSIDLLEDHQSSNNIHMSQADLEQLSRDVEIKLADFNIKAQVVAVYPGPVVTRYEVDLAAGTKVSKITALAKDLARSLSVVSVRVVEVIPGKSVIGIELPNANRAMVSLREVFASDAFVETQSTLPLALGKDIAGHGVVVDLAKMPHLLVAGTTGSGKSVGLNAMLLSLLYKASPQQLRIILIDPKMLELAIYEDIPHLLVPVVTDMKKAANALRWCVVEMERRYRLMAAVGVRNLAGYNQKVNAAIASGEPLPDPLIEPGVDGPTPTLSELPKIVIIADEFADMMMVVGKKIEVLIARLAQKARAAGIHLIFATQRPSVDVITGLIKANIPTRIAFQVSSRVDSRTILDQQGAEHLLGHGDMLYLAPGTGIPIRVHGAYVSDEEVHSVVDFLKSTSEPDYLNEILGDDVAQNAAQNDPMIASIMGESGDDSSSSADKDVLFDQAVEFVAQSRKASISSVQRRFKIGYNRAARIVEEMEAQAMVGPLENGSREVLMPKPRDGA